MASLLQLCFLLLLLQTCLSEYCTKEEFIDVQTNIHSKYEVSPGYEVCLKYSLPESKSKISLMFFGSISLTSEVIFYKSKSDISMDNDGSYKNFYERFLIHENEFIQIDVKDFSEEIFIIIRDQKDDDYNEGTLIIYDSEVPIPLLNGQALNMRKFMDDTKYVFTYTSKNDLTFAFSSKVKSKKYLTATYGENTVIERKLYDTDELLNLINEDTTEKTFTVTVEEIEPGKENEDFSVILYEGGPVSYNNIPKNVEVSIDYINLDKNDMKQTLYFYYCLENDYESNTINFVLDPLANKTNYINIEAGIYHSTKNLTKKEMENSFHYDKDSLPVKYDENSDTYKRIYFRDESKDFQFRYVFFKVEISKLDQYYGSKEFIITISDETEVIDLTSVDYHKTQTLEFEVDAYFPKYYKLLLDPKEEYIFTSSVPNSSLFLIGDLLLKNETTQQYTIINNNKFEDFDEIFELSELSEFTIRIFEDELIRKKIYIEKYSDNEMMINEYSRSDRPLDIELTPDDCRLGKKKYILGIYDKELYPKGDETTETRYWTTINGGEMTLYYRDNILLEGESLFPTNPEYIIEKDKVFLLNNYIDFFTITCTKSGIFSLRALHKSYDETTHIITQNSIDDISIEGNQTEIILLSAPIIPPTDYLYFSIFSLDGKPVLIEPDTDRMFNYTKIEGKNLFKLQIKLADYKTDELAVRVTAEDRTRIEILEIIRYNFTEYTVIDKNKAKVTDNQFVKFLDTDVNEIKVKISGLKSVPISYGLVKLSTKELNYLPLAYQFNDEYKITNRILLKDEEIVLKNEFKGVKDNKDFLAFVFSIKKYEYYEYEVEFTEDGRSSHTLLIVLLVLLGLILLVGLVMLIMFIIKKRKEAGEEKLEGKFDDIQNGTNQAMLDEDQ